MWYTFSLRQQIYLVLFGVVGIAFFSCLIILWHNFQIKNLLTEMVEDHLPAYQAAEKLETALINQKGYVSYYFIDGDEAWLKMLAEDRRRFLETLVAAELTARRPEEKAILQHIHDEYHQYITLKDQVIELYRSGERERGVEQHKPVRRHFFEIISECERFKQIHADRIKQAGEASHREAGRLRIIAVVLVVNVFLLCLLLLLILARRILDPLRRLADESGAVRVKTTALDEVRAVSQNVHDLMEDAGQKNRKLEESRKHLQQSEKMALVGKLAAGMAHSVRNPLTSVKMRLFSLKRTALLNDTQREDFEVIAEEIQHIDTIVQNFLEFSRPPKLNMQRISLSAVLDLALQLLTHRLKSYDVTVQHLRQQSLPEIDCDPEQLKEVIVNLIINACEAMTGSGTLVISEKTHETPDGQRLATISLADNGPGIPADIRDKVFQPFFTTKDEGTGLGLSIAARIVEEHGGYLDFRTEVDQGTTFTLSFPL